jgi:Na+-translocating ferredoxin:NAD+ oxidoreductase RnfC subunit
LGADYNQKV